MINSTSLVSQPISSSQSFNNIGATDIAFHQTPVMGAPSILASTVTPASNISTVDWTRTNNSSTSNSSSMPSLISASDTSTVNRLADQNTSAISNIVVRIPSAITLTSQPRYSSEVTIPFTAAGSPVYSEVIFNVPGEQHWHFKDHVRLVVIAVNKLNAINTILRTWFRLDDSFELQSITISDDSHKIIPAVITKDLHAKQLQLLAAVKSDFFKGKFSDPMMIQNKCSVPIFLFEFFELVGITTFSDLKSIFTKAESISVMKSICIRYRPEHSVEKQDLTLDQILLPI